MPMTFTAEQSRVDALIRLMGIMVLGLGVVWLYLTYANANAAGIASEIITINYALGVLLVIVGFFAGFARFK